MEATIVYRGYIGIREKKMETTRIMKPSNILRSIHRAGGGGGNIWAIF